ncbi:uncharacterized protein LOC142584321 [Dermacentor variabilis]|uniref:uncharacterized protein LOC142584321 n=1 Tax=Dermacentor variabilis TaxID=34621 RepID=UPI003F5B58F4
MGCRGLVLACFALSMLQSSSSMTTKKAMMDSESMKPGKHQGSPGDKMQGATMSASTPGQDDEEDSMESESMEADQMGQGTKNCTMPGMDMSGKKDMTAARVDMKGGATTAPAKAGLKGAKMGADMMKAGANCTVQRMGGMMKGGGSDMTKMINEKGSMQSTMATPRGRRN